MNWFKRLCMFLFGLSGTLSLVALSLVWVGPWTTQARTLITENSQYFLALEILVCVSGVGLVACMLVALFAPRNPKETIVASVAGGNITVTRTAIAAQARHVIEADGTCEATSIRVRVRKRGKVRVNVRVRPHLPLDVVARGEVLYAELEQGLAKVCGSSVRSIGLVFLEPEQQGSLSMYVDTADDAQAQASEAAAPAQDITVSMSPAPASEPEPESAEDDFGQMAADVFESEEADGAAETLAGDPVEPIAEEEV